MSKQAMQRTKKPKPGAGTFNGENSMYPSLSPSVRPSSSRLGPSSRPSTTASPSSRPSNVPSISTSPSKRSSSLPTHVPSPIPPSLIAPTVAQSNKPSGTTGAPTYVKHQTVIFTYIMGLPSSKDLSGASYTSKTLTTKGTHWYIIHHVTQSIVDTLQGSTSIPNSIQVQDSLQIQNQDIVSDVCPDVFLEQSRSCFRIVTSIHLDIFSSNTQSETQISTLIVNEISDAMEGDGTFLNSYQNDILQFQYVGLGSILVKPKDYNEKLAVKGSIIGVAVFVVVSLILFKCRNIRKKSDDQSENDDGMIGSLAKRFRKSNKEEDDDGHPSFNEDVITPNTTFSPEVSPTSVNNRSPYTADWHNHPEEYDANPSKSSSSRNEWNNITSVPEEKQAAPNVYSFDWQDNPSIPQQRQRSPSIGNPLPYHTRNTSHTGSLESNLSVEREAFQDHPSTPDISVGTNSTGSFSLDKYFKKRDTPEDEDSDDGGDRSWWN